MQKIRVGAAATVLLATLVLTASAQATVTTTNITAPADGTLLFQNLDTAPSATVTITGTTDGTAGDLIDIGCYSGQPNGSGPYDYHPYEGGAGNPGIAVGAGGSFTVAVPQSVFAGGTCHLVAVPHGTPLTVLPAGDTGPRVGFSEFYTNRFSSGANSGMAYDYKFNDVTTLASNSVASIDDCGPWGYLVDGTSAMNVGNTMLYCAGSFYNSSSDLSGSLLLSPNSEIQVDGQNAYGSSSAESLFNSAGTLPGFPSLSASVDIFNSLNGDAQTTESEELVKCTPNDVYSPTSTDCTAFAPTGVSIKRVTDFTDGGRIATVKDVYTSTDGLAHSLNLGYETDLNQTAAGWEFPGAASFTTPAGDGSGPAASSAPATIYAIYNVGSAPSLANPVAALSYSTPYNSVMFYPGLWGGETSAVFSYQLTVPAGGSNSLTWSYATGASLAEVQADAAAAVQAMQAAADATEVPTVAISSPLTGATLTSSPATVTGTASAGSGVKSVTVDGVAATLSGGSWSASVPLNPGKNTLTADLTSNGGGSATATVTVTYAPPVPVTVTPSPQLTVTRRRFNGNAVQVRLACAASGSKCSGRLTIDYTRIVVRHHRKHRIAAVIARATYSLNPGQTATVAAPLNRTGKRLLEAHHRLATKATITLRQLDGKSPVATHFGLMLKQHTRHRKHRR